MLAIELRGGGGGGGGGFQVPFAAKVDEPSFYRRNTPRSRVLFSRGVTLSCPFKVTALFETTFAELNCKN